MMRGVLGFWHLYFAAMSSNAPSGQQLAQNPLHLLLVLVKFSTLLTVLTG